MLATARKIAVATAAATCLVVALPAGEAGASSGGRVFSADQAGYAATGARFYAAGIWAKLPNAAHFSGQLGRVGVSVQLWTRHLVFDLTVSACTDKTCRPGGKPLTRRYRPVLSIYDVSTHALVCSTAAATAKGRCPGVQRSWHRCAISPKQTVNLAMEYFHPTGFLNAQVQGGQCSTDAGYAPGPGLVVNQVRIAAQFGATPWTPSHIRSPRATERVLTLGIPPPPPYYAEIGIYTSQFYGACIGARWTHHAIAMTSNGSRTRAPQATPTTFWAHGCDFGIDLKRT